MSREKKDKVDALLTALTSRQPGKRQIKPVDTSMLQLFEDMDDDTDSEYVAESASAEEEEEDDADVYAPGEESNDNDNEQEEDSESESDSDSDEDKPKTSLTRPTNSTSETIIPNADDNSVTPSVNSSVVDGKDSHEIQETPKPQRKSAEVALKNLPKSDPSPIPAFHETKRHKQNILICMFCLSDENYCNNELIECDSCGICVHESCYGMSDVISISSTGSSASTEPWFCEACLAGETTPICQLCPVLGGIYKRTDMNQWVHLVCALYTPGVAFNDVDQLTSVTLTELSPKEWSSKECSLCEDKFYAWTGVCISCDAGLCRSFFHVTCAQKHGFLSEPNNEENCADPYFAQCRQHTDKTVVKHRRRNLLTAMTRQRQVMEQRGLVGNDKSRERVSRKLKYQCNKYTKWFNNQPQPYAPERKVPLFFETNPAAMRLFLKKASNLGLPIDLTVQQATDAQKSGIAGVPVFSPDFVLYFIDREKKIDSLSSRLSELEHLQRKLQIDDGNSSHTYNRCTNKRAEMKSKLDSLRGEINKLWFYISKLNPEIVKSTELEELLLVEKSEPVVLPENELSTVAAIVRDRRYGIHSKKSALYLRNLSTNQVNGNGDAKQQSEDNSDAQNVAKPVVINECQICRGLHDQHLLILCDTCAKYFHLACLEPPLTRMPKKTKLYGWQCSWCTKALTTDSDDVTVDVDAPRKLRKPVSTIEVNNSCEPMDEPAAGKSKLIQKSIPNLPTYQSEEKPDNISTADVPQNKNDDTKITVIEAPAKKKPVKRKKPSLKEIPKKVAKVNINPLSRGVKSIRSSVYSKPNRKRMIPAKFRDSSPFSSSIASSKTPKLPKNLSPKKASFTLDKKPNVLPSLKIPKICINRSDQQNSMSSASRSSPKLVRTPPLTMTVASKNNPIPTTFQGNPRDPRLKHQQKSDEQFQRIVQMLGQQKQKLTTSVTTGATPLPPTTGATPLPPTAGALHSSVMSSLLRYPMSDQNSPGEPIKKPFIVSSAYQHINPSYTTSPAVSQSHPLRESPSRRQAALVAISAVRGEPLPAAAQINRNSYQMPQTFFNFGTSQQRVDSHLTMNSQVHHLPPAQNSPDSAVSAQANCVKAPSSVFSSTSDDESVTSSEGHARESSKCSSNSFQESRQYKICSNKSQSKSESTNKLTIKVLKSDRFSPAND